MLPMRLIRSIAAMLFVFGCGQVDYDNAPIGEFEGTLFVMWVGEGGNLGSGKFVYVPNPRDPLRFVRNAKTDYRIIEPGMMYTDGGSIPKLAQAFNGFSPWGYAPAYMVHDWLFVARHCLSDGKPEKAHVPLEGMTFQESADIMAEAIATLIHTQRVARNDLAPPLISSVVGGPISKGYWDRKGSCDIERVSEPDRAAAAAGIPGSNRRLRGMMRTLPDGTATPVRPAVVVGVVTF